MSDVASLRGRAAAVLAVVAGCLAALTAILPDWIEAAFDVDPDAGNGSFEWLIVAALAAIAIASATYARSERAVGGSSHA
jgi:hypothetical protein